MYFNDKSVENDLEMAITTWLIKLRRKFDQNGVQELQRNINQLPRKLQESLCLVGQKHFFYILS